MGSAMMGTGEASGDKRALRSAEAAISNPLMDDHTEITGKFTFAVSSPKCNSAA